MTLWTPLISAGLLAGAAFGLWRVARPRPRLEIGDRGIRGPVLGRGWIPWEEIEGAYPPTAADSNTLSLRLRVTQRLAAVLGRGRRTARELPPEGTLVVPVDLAGSGLSAVDVLQEILAHRDTDPDRTRVPDLG